MAQTHQHIEEKHAFYMNGWLVIFILLVLGVSGAKLLLGGLLVFSFTGLICILLVAFCIKGFTIIDPNYASVLTFFGKYIGTINESGFFWCNPLANRLEVSLRETNFTTEVIKVNDLAGNPIEIAAVISWRTQDTAKAIFSVNNFSVYVKTACESAIREVASSRYYDHIDEKDTGKTLRGDLEGVANLLQQKVADHVQVAGIQIISAKITHLAYASEIAMAMLRRQQASAVVAARTTIVAGAVGMVKEALQKIEEEQIATLDSHERAALVTNLMTVLVSETEAQPVISLNK